MPPELSVCGQGSPGAATSTSPVPAIRQSPKLSGTANTSPALKVIVPAPEKEPDPDSTSAIANPRRISVLSSDVGFGHQIRKYGSAADGSKLRGRGASPTLSL